MEAPEQCNHRVHQSFQNVSLKLQKLWTNRTFESLYLAGKYDIKGDFDKNATYSAGFSLGLKPKSSLPEKTPGPADYSPTHKNLPKSPSITLSCKYKEVTLDRSPSPNQVNQL